MHRSLSDDERSSTQGEVIIVVCAVVLGCFSAWQALGGNFMPTASGAEAGVAHIDDDSESHAVYEEVPMAASFDRSRWMVEVRDWDPERLPEPKLREPVKLELSHGPRVFNQTVDGAVADAQDPGMTRRSTVRP